MYCDDGGVLQQPLVATTVGLLLFHEKKISVSFLYYSINLASASSEPKEGENPQYPNISIGVK
jgi:hypothetical protein